MLQERPHPFRMAHPQQRNSGVSLTFGKLFLLVFSNNWPMPDRSGDLFVLGTDGRCRYRHRSVAVHDQFSTSFKLFFGRQPVRFLRFIFSTDLPDELRRFHERLENAQIEALTALTAEDVALLEEVANLIASRLDQYNLLTP